MITTKEFDKKFDDGQDISEYLDFTKSARLKDLTLSTKSKKLDIEFPEWIVNSLEFEAKKIGVTMDAIIKLWIVERLKNEQLC